jgi:ubiquinone/menaquinone biosynthesis C-methylase UbiE
VTDGPRSYERYLVPEFFVPCAEQLVRLAAPAAGERAVDLACGTGVVARRLADRGLSVTGVDVTDAMVAFAAAAEPRVDWRVAAAGALPLGDGTVDVVCCQQGLQFFPDPAGAMRDVHRVLDPALVDRLGEQLERALAPYTDDDGVVLPMQTWLVTACR